MSQSLSYRLGKTFGRLPRWARWILVAAFVGLLYNMCSTSSSTPSPPPHASAAKAPAKAASTALELAAVQLPKQKEACQNEITQRRAKYAAHMKERKYWDAAADIRACAHLLSDPSLLALVKDAEVRSLLAEINNTKTPLRAKARAIELLARDYPDVGARYQPEVPKLIAAAEKQEAAAEARHKRSEGVRIGMSKADVLASSWGRPERVNTTTNVYGTREQWVYGSRNYLYFENDVLVSIQN